MTALKLVCILFCLIGTLTVFTQKKFDELLPVALMGAGLLCYLAGLAGNMGIGYLLLLAAAAFFPCYFVRLSVKGELRSEKGRGILARLLTPGAAIYLLLFVVIFALNRTRSLAMWDELMQWGPFVREMLRTNQLFSSASSAVLIHKEYDPMLSILQVLLCKIRGTYQEKDLFAALQLLGISFFIPALKHYDWKNLKTLCDKLSLAGIALLIFVFPIIFDCYEAAFYTSVYVDCTVGLTFGFAIYLCFTNTCSRFDWAALTITNAFLILEKDVSIVLFAFVFVMTFLRWITDRFTVPSHGSKVRWLQVCISGGVPALFWVSYKIFLHFNNAPQSFNSSFSIKTLFQVLLGREPSGLSELFYAFLRHLLVEPINNFTGDTNFQMSYVQLTLLISGVILLLAMLFPAQKRALLLMSGYSCAMAAGWAFAILNVYLFVFNGAIKHYEADYAGYFTMYCFHRYLSTAIVGLAFFCCMILISCLRTNKSWKPLLIAAALALAVFLPSGSRYQKLFQQYQYAGYYDADVFFLQTHTLPDDAVYVLSPRIESTAPMYLYYKLLPRYCNPYDQLSESYQQYEYLYLYSVDDELLEEYGHCFGASEEIIPRSLYKIMPDKNGFSLELLETMGE